jgi:hypothetical protein
MTNLWLGPANHQFDGRIDCLSGDLRSGGGRILLSTGAELAIVPRLVQVQCRCVWPIAGERVPADG